ncbi:uncharacterized protein LOC133850227 [Drosophila sulfurigaster albostrigata]|uniref:LOW QUALITY PROTEIN: uncharacterized protein LOC132789830 n=1 Tax=Drosophila nasuta TaxID=42062 RepID=UPI00295F1897|nr:LOW QUALITY PROTEIN: uncharacterized protein LOC132789830 [Drosophila nasuta]XP_062142249.1 uncharacterized protein LOC133850227 [Drosophila sulfurigaster albostrigata]XP_062142250.1 uncharacterized protein LOC133850227 [Drosophila sulfurigaster albostrigata]
MNSNSIRKLLLLPLKRISCPDGLQQVRHHAPIVGPPRFRLSMGQKALYGWGSLLFMMIIPMWSLYSMPRWSALHNNLPWDEDEPPKEEEPKEQ